LFLEISQNVKVKIQTMKNTESLESFKGKVIKFRKKMKSAFWHTITISSVILLIFYALIFIWYCTENLHIKILTAGIFTIAFIFIIWFSFRIFNQEYNQVFSQVIRYMKSELELEQECLDRTNKALSSMEEKEMDVSRFLKNNETEQEIQAKQEKLDWLDSLPPWW